MTGILDALIEINNLKPSKKPIYIKLNVHVQRTGQSTSGPLLPRPHQNSPHYGPKHHTVALHRIEQVIILLRNYFYFILARSRVVPTLSALSTALLGWFTSFSPHPLLCFLTITTRAKLLQSSQLLAIFNCKASLSINTLSFVQFTLRGSFISCLKLSVLLLC
jgi:hypothetical protein